MSMTCKVDIYPETITLESILSRRSNVDLTSVEVDICLGTVSPKLILSQKGNVYLASEFPMPRDNFAHTQLLDSSEIFKHNFLCN